MYIVSNRSLLRNTLLTSNCIRGQLREVATVRGTSQWQVWQLGRRSPCNLGLLVERIPCQLIRPCTVRLIHQLYVWFYRPMHLHPMECFSFGRGTTVYVLFCSIACNSSFMACLQCRWDRFGGSIVVYMWMKWLWWSVCKFGKVSYMKGSFGVGICR